MDIIYKVQTSKSFEQAVEDLKTSVSNHRFGVLWELNFKDKLMEKGLTLERNFKILEVCNPNQAKKAFDAFGEIGYFLPCKMAVYENDGQVFIGMLRPTELIGLIMNADLSGIAQEVESELKAAIDSAK